MKILDVPQSGSQAGTTASRNRYGQYRRTRAMPVQPRTPAQVSVRQMLTAASNKWKSLTDEIQEAWRAYAAGHPKTDSLGQTIYLTGHQMYVSFYCLAAAAGGNFQDVPPQGAPAPPPEVSFTFGVELNEEGDDLETCDVVVTGDNIANINAQCFASAPVSAGVNFPPNKVQIARTNLNTSPETLDFSVPYVQRFGLPAVGQKVFATIKLSLNGRPLITANLEAIVGQVTTP